MTYLKFHSNRVVGANELINDHDDDGPCFADDKE